jgi:hypothetical protein
LDALSAARRSTTALSFPPEAADKSSESAQQGPAQATPRKGEASSLPAVASLREIARAIKECPETVEIEHKWGKAPQEIDRVLFGPPKNVVWDIEESKSVRSPFTGYIQFSVSHYHWVPAETLDRYERKYPGLDELLMFMPDLEYRYEFDVGPEGLELARVLARSVEKAEWGDSPKRDVCWDKAARKGGVVGYSGKR